MSHWTHFYFVLFFFLFLFFVFFFQRKKGLTFLVSHLPANVKAYFLSKKNKKFWYSFACHYKG